MAEPTLILTPEQRRNRAGAVPVTLAGGVKLENGAWVLEEGTTNLWTNPRAISTGTAWGTNVTNVTRSYLTGLTVNHPSGAVLSTAARSTVTATPSSGTRIGLTFADSSPAGTAVNGQMVVRGVGSTVGKPFRLRVYEIGGAGGTVFTEGPLVTLTDQWQLLKVTRITANADHTTLGLYLFDAGAAGVAGEIVDATAAQVEKKPATTTYADGTLGSGYGWTGTANASTSTRAAGSVSAPLPSFGSLYVRHGGTRSVLTGPGDLVPGATVSHAGGQLTIAATEGTAIELVAAFDEVLTLQDVAALDAMPTRDIARMLSRPRFPAYRSGVFTVEPTIYRTDKLNEAREDITRYVTDIAVDGDVARTASKMECSISTYRDVIDDGDWIAPYVTYAPETGERVSTQVGHLRLDSPTVEYDGTGAVFVSALGTDILEMLDTAVLPTTFYTPRYGYVMRDIRTLIQMATRGRVGTNLVQNPSFEAESGGTLASWVGNGTFAGGGSGSITWEAVGYDTPSGDRVWGPTFNASQPAGAYASVYQDVQIPGHMIGQRVWLSGVWLPSHRDHRGYLVVDFYDASNVPLSGKSIQTPNQMRTPLRWTRESADGVIPENAAYARVRVVVVDAVGGYSGPRRSAWDDITFQTISGEPLPDSRIALPAIDAVASSRIQSEAGVSYLTAINDRLWAAGCHELYTTLDGRLTSRLLGNAGAATAAQVFTEDDLYVAETAMVQRDPSNRYNAVLALKEGVQGDPSLSAYAYNEDTADPWSIYGDMGVVTKTITVQDAVDLPSLQAVADQELLRASEQESLDITVLPGPQLNLNDTIRVDTEDRTKGLWDIATIQWGMTIDDQLLRIGGRRTVRKGRAA